MSLAPALLAPAASRAQSGRKRERPSASPEPGAQRPRRTAPAGTDHAPGQPSTPDAPSSAATPAPSPKTASAGVVSAASSPAAGDEPVEVEDDEVVRVNSNLVPVSANVMDAAGRAVTNLTLEDFELRVDGQPKPIGGLSHAETPVRLALLFDNSASQRATRELEKLAAVRFFRRVLRPVDQAALFYIWTEPIFAQPLTSDVQTLVRAIERAGEAEGSTSLFDTIVMAADYLRPQTGRKVIVIVSDGVETTSRLDDFGEVVRRVLADDCQVFVVQTGLSENANLRDLVAERRMQELTGYTGGAVYVPKGANDLDSAYAQIAADLAQQYVLSYYPTEEPRDSRFRVINLRVKTRPGLRVRARRGYYPRARGGEQLSNRLVAATDWDASAAGNAARQADRSTQLAPPGVAVANGGAVVPDAPSYGSKNMDVETGGTRARPGEADAGARTAAVVIGPKPDPPPVIEAASDAKLSPPTIGSDATASPSVTAPPEAESAPAPTPQNPTQETAAATTPAAATAQPPRSTTPPAASSKTAKAESPAPPTAGTAKTPISGGVLNAKAIKLPRPDYPDTARRARVFGAVTVAVTIEETGRVAAARAVGGPQLLRAAAEGAARRATFTPTLVSGRPVAVSGFITYNFSQ